jgi:Peptidase family M23
VVKVVDDAKEVPPGLTTSETPTLEGPSSYSGNQVVVRAKPGVYAFYAHMIPGSVAVHDGQHFSTGQRIGSKGTTDGPHLHFGLNDSIDPPTANSLPRRLRPDRFEGAGRFDSQFNLLTSGSSHPAHDQFPLHDAVVGF